MVSVLDLSDSTTFLGCDSFAFAAPQPNSVTLALILADRFLETCKFRVTDSKSS